MSGRAVTAIYKGSPRGSGPAILRSYDSRKEPAPEFNCTIWQAGRATSATGLAFKPIQIGQSMFIDEGAGQYNPAPFVLDEACINEWPGREVGVFVSIGTGKRPAGSDHNQHLWYEGFMGDFAEARKRLVQKIEGCENTHQMMLKEGLMKRGVNVENYYRLNVEIGVGEFGMNEWNRLADISTSTRRYLGKHDVQRMNLDAAAKLAKIHFAKQRLEGRTAKAQDGLADVPEASVLQDPLAVELPAEVPPPQRVAPNRPSYENGSESLAVRPPVPTHSPRSSSDSRRQKTPPTSATGSFQSPTIKPEDRLLVNAPTPDQYRTAGGADKIAIMSLDEYPRVNDPPLVNAVQALRQEPPPLPPKTPIQDGTANGGRKAAVYRERLNSAGRDTTRPPLPYPDDDGPPPIANMARKPEYGARR